MKSRSFNVSKDCLTEVQDFITIWSKSQGISMKISSKLAVCSDEIVSNVVFYSDASNLEIECEISDTEISLTFIDDGKPFDPFTEVQEPDVTAALEDREAGGLGIFMVKKMASSTAYERQGNKNEVIIKISIA
ncbi:MAG: ATP-binding protein [Fibrobacter sp.]|nr:ATP-binding protein [Fibrobacter sp.]